MKKLLGLVAGSLLACFVSGAQAEISLINDRVCQTIFRAIGVG